MKIKEAPGYIKIGASVLSDDKEKLKAYKLRKRKQRSTEERINMLENRIMELEKKLNAYIN